jgi:hypothetical protein
VFLRAQCAAYQFDDVIFAGIRWDQKLPTHVLRTKDAPFCSYCGNAAAAHTNIAMRSCCPPLVSQDRWPFEPTSAVPHPRARAARMASTIQQQREQEQQQQEYEDETGLSLLAKRDSTSSSSSLSLCSPHSNKQPSSVKPRAWIPTVVQVAISAASAAVVPAAAATSVVRAGVGSAPVRVLRKISGVGMGTR